MKSNKIFRPGHHVVWRTSRLHLRNIDCFKHSFAFLMKKQSVKIYLNIRFKVTPSSFAAISPFELGSESSIIQWLFICINAYVECKWLLLSNNSVIIPPKMYCIQKQPFEISSLKWSSLMRRMVLGASPCHFPWALVHLMFIVVHYSLPRFSYFPHPFLICDLFK